MSKKVYTREEVAKHHSKDDCWIIIGGKVYDATRVLKDHPGGDDILLSLAAKDDATVFFTHDFEDVGQSSTARALSLDVYLLGDIGTPKVYTFDEVSKHNSREDCWLIIDGKVYDVTRFLVGHPGGDDILLSSTAKDATDDFKDVGHTTTARVIMDRYLLGEIDKSTIPARRKYAPAPKQPNYNQDKNPQYGPSVLASWFRRNILWSSTAKDATHGFEDVGHNKLTITTKSKSAPTMQSDYNQDKNLQMEETHIHFDMMKSILGGSWNPRNINLSFLRLITRNFFDELRIGNGGCGVVYKGILPNGYIAVKRLLNTHTIEDNMFHQEVKTMMMVNHQNVVRFLGYCSQTEEEALKIDGKILIAQIRERLLCFEYLSNGSLDSYLTDELRGLDWHTRYQIIKGICDGLHHLHCKNHIIHMDLKPANILLDSNMVPKITDFGLSRFDDISHTMSSDRLLSLGYCAPEYLDDGKMSAKSDIYSLGVIILELLTGSKNPNITKVHRRWKHRWNKSAKDAQLRGYIQVATCLTLAQICIQKNPTDRPNIWDIISVLNEMESNGVHISDANEYLELEGMLGIQPLEIYLPFEVNKQISCSVELTNDTDDHFAFRITTTSLRRYYTTGNKGTLPPRSKCDVTITLQAQERALPSIRCRDEFSVESTRVDGSLTPTDIVGDIFREKPGKMVDTVNLTVILISTASPSGCGR